MIMFYNISEFSELTLIEFVQNESNVMYDYECKNPFKIIIGKHKGKTKYISIMYKERKIEKLPVYMLPTLCEYMKKANKKQVECVLDIFEHTIKELKNI